MLGAQLNGQGKRYEVEGIRVLTLGPLNFLYPLLGIHHVAGSIVFISQLKILSYSSSFSLHMRVQAHEV